VGVSLTKKVFEVDMIYTVTLNPAVDYIMELERFTIGSTNRAESEKYFIGGKGINVSRVLKELGIESVALGFVAGFTGDIICSFLDDCGIKNDFVFLEKGFSRINVKLKTGSETEINGKGPDIPGKSLDEFFKKLGKIKDGDTLILAGSVPSSLPNDIYEKIMQKLSGKNVSFVVDAAGELLLNTLKYKPFLIKPNIDELTQLFGKRPENDDETILFAKELQKKGARNVLVSLGKEGAALVDENGGTSKVFAHSGKAKNTVGSGDSMIAGFIAGIKKTSDFSYALSLGNAAGAATAFCDDLAKRDLIEKIIDIK
jgi:1-phosphofructokinase